MDAHRFASVVVERYEEQVRPVQLLQHRLAVVAPGHGFAEGAREPVEDRGVEEEGAHVLRLALEHLLGYPERHGRGVVWDSFWSAWDAFAGASSYKDTIERAIAYGNDLFDHLEATAPDGTTDAGQAIQERGI